MDGTQIAVISAWSTVYAFVVAHPRRMAGGLPLDQPFATAPMNGEFGS